MSYQQIEIDGVEYAWQTVPYGDGYFTASWWCLGGKERHELGYGLISHTAVSFAMEKHSLTAALTYLLSII